MKNEKPKIKKVILSFDYELFFGFRSGTIVNTLIKPTNLLLNELEKANLRGNFFIDYTMFKAYENLNDSESKDDLNLLKNQVKDIIKRGHRIELHLHPHWIDAIYNGDGTWNFSNFEHYSLSSLPEDKIVDLFIEGTNYLTNLANEVNKNYKICAFRAGGWAVQPFASLKKAFSLANIKIDSSASFGIFQKTKYSFFDFSNMPNKCLYHFDDDVCCENSNGLFIEIPITSFHRGLFYVIVDKIFSLFLNYNKYIFSDGTHNRIKDESPQKKKFWLKFKSNHKLMYSFCSFSKYTTLANIRNHKNEFCCFIDHPKDLSKATIEGIRSLKGITKSIFYSDLL